jgi:probable F420-dependent oxidoreductase
LKLDVELLPADLSEVPELSKRAEGFGFDGVWVNETKHDPFVQLTLAATGTSTVELGTSIALAFTRSPTTLAYSSWDVQGLSNGRLILGLGSQVKGHVERRFGMKWERPAAKMKEVVSALRAIWRSWQKGERLDFHGEFFNLDLMTPFFDPGPLERPGIPIYVAAVNPGMCRLVGEVADGLHVHPLHTKRYLEEVALPALSRGLAASGRGRESVSVAASVFAAVGRSGREVELVRNAYRNQVAFYASTRTYRRVMELQGWGDVCDELHRLSLRREWEEMGRAVPDDVLDNFVVSGTWEQMGETLRRRYAGLADRVRLYLPFDGGEAWKRLVSGFRR